MDLLYALALAAWVVTAAPEQAPADLRARAQQLTEQAAALGKERGRDAEALAAYREALAAWRSAADTREAARTLLVIGRLEALSGRKAEGREAFAEAATMFQTVNDAAGEADAHYGVARQQFDLFDTAGAIVSYEKAVALERRGDDRFGLALALNNLAAALRETGDTARAMECFREALAIRVALDDRPGVGYTLYGIAAIYWSRGDGEQALQTYAEALANWRALGDRTNEANTLNGMGLAYQTLGDRERALASYRDALEAWRAVKSPAGEAYTLSNLGMADMAANRLTPAQESYERALALLRTAKDLRGQAYVLHNLGDLQMRRGRAADARQFYDESLVLKQQLGDRFGEAYTLQRMGEALLSMGDASGALQRATQARDLHRAVADRPGEAAALAATARAQEALGQRSDARQAMLTALTMIERMRVDVANDELRASYFATHQDYYEYLIALLMRAHAEAPQAGFDREALEVSERTRSRVLLDRLADTLGAQDADDPVGRRRRLALQIKEQMAWVREAAQTGRRADAARLDALIAEYDALDRSLSTLAPRASAIDTPAPLDIGRLQKEIVDRETLLLEFALGKDGSYAWLVAPTAITAVRLPPRAVIDGAVRRYLDALTARSLTSDTTAAARAARIAKADADLPAAARALATMVLAPIERQLRAPRLVVVADGSLRGVPFAALPLGDGSPLVARHEVAAVASASLAAAFRLAGSATDRRSSVAVFADPVFSCDDERAPAGSACKAGTGLSRLRYSEVEADAIRAAVKQSTVLSGFDAMRPALTRPEVRRADVLHFATHAVVDEAVPARSHIVLSQIDRRGQAIEQTLGLAAIAGLDLEASTVVLSACRTALGVPQAGEGLIGLTRAFFLAGARRVVATLWEVQDRATADLMGRFYAAMFTKGLSPSAALRQAQQSLRATERWQHPYYWAGVTVNGDWR